MRRSIRPTVLICQAIQQFSLIKTDMLSNVTQKHMSLLPVLMRRYIHETSLRKQMSQHDDTFYVDALR